MLFTNRTFCDYPSMSAVHTLSPPSLGLTMHGFALVLSDWEETKKIGRGNINLADSVDQKAIAGGWKARTV